MTREEVKSCICTIKMLQKLAYNIHGVMDVVDVDNCKKIIKALGQESCNDAISRQAAIDCLNADFTIDGKENMETVVDYITGAFKQIKALPSVTPHPKVGHWVLADEQNKEDVENDNYRFICSECQCSDIHSKGTKVPYCWKCGAKMVEPQESEDKE